MNETLTDGQGQSPSIPKSKLSPSEIRTTSIILADLETSILGSSVEEVCRSAAIALGAFMGVRLEGIPDAWAQMGQAAIQAAEESHAMMMSMDEEEAKDG